MMPKSALARRSITRIRVPFYRLAVSGALLVTAAVYLEAAFFDFVYDDFEQIVYNPGIKSWDLAIGYFKSHVWAQSGSVLPLYYRPVFMLWLRANHALFGLHPLYSTLLPARFHALAEGESRSVRSASVVLAFGGCRVAPALLSAPVLFRSPVDGRQVGCSGRGAFVWAASGTLGGRSLDFRRNGDADGGAAFWIPALPSETSGFRRNQDGQMARGLPDTGVSRGTGQGNSLRDAGPRIQL